MLVYLSRAVTPVYVSQEVETLAVHSLLTIKNRSNKKELESAKTAGFCSAGHILQLDQIKIFLAFSSS